MTNLAAIMMGGMLAAKKARIKSPSQILKNLDKNLGKRIELCGMLFTDTDPDIGTKEGNLLCVYVKDENTDDKVYVTMDGQLPADVPGTSSTVLERILAKSEGVAELAGGMGKRLFVVLPGTVLKDFKKFESDMLTEQVYLDLDMSTVVRNEKDS